MASVLRMHDETGATLPYSSNLKLYLEFDRVELVGPSSNEPQVSEVALKEWVWQNCKDSLLPAMSIKFEEKDEKPQEEEIRKSRQRLELLDTIAEVQRKYLQMEKVRPVHLLKIFATLLYFFSGVILMTRLSYYSFFHDSRVWYLAIFLMAY
jgi:hypothetical protein